MALLRRPAPGASGAYGELAALWVEGLNAPHAADCGCGGMAAPALDPASVEWDVLDYLIGKYRVDAPELAAYLGERRGQSSQRPFEAWLASLAEAPLTPGAQDRLMTDLKTFLDSFAARGRPRVGICY